MPSMELHTDSEEETRYNTALKRTHIWAMFLLILNIRGQLWSA